MNLFKAFDEAKRRCFDRLRDFTCARIPLPWAAAIAEEIAAGFGPDPFPYGIEPSRPTIEAFCRYCHDQGVTHRRMTRGRSVPARGGPEIGKGLIRSPRAASRPPAASTP